jgi:hypothetical protein
METRILDSELPLEENFYEHGKKICEAKELSFMTINFYNVSHETQEFILGILKQFNFKAENPRKYSDKVNAVIINL